MQARATPVAQLRRTDKSKEGSTVKAQAQSSHPGLDCHTSQRQITPASMNKIKGELTLVHIPIQSCWNAPLDVLCPVKALDTECMMQLQRTYFRQDTYSSPSCHNNSIIWAMLLFKICQRLNMHLLQTCLGGITKTFKPLFTASPQIPAE